MVYMFTKDMVYMFKKDMVYMLKKYTWCICVSTDMTVYVKAKTYRVYV